MRDQLEPDLRDIERAHDLPPDEPYTHHGDGAAWVVQITGDGDYVPQQARCDACGWTGPERRTLGEALQDAEGHECDA